MGHDGHRRLGTLGSSALAAGGAGGAAIRQTDSHVLIAVGTAGVGKTHLAVAALNAVAKCGKAVLFADEGFFRSSHGAEHYDATRDLEAADLVVLDGLNNERGGGVHFMRAAVRHAFEQRKALLVTSNMRIDGACINAMRYRMGIDAPSIKNTLVVPDRVLPSFRKAWAVPQPPSGTWAVAAVEQQAIESPPVQKLAWPMYIPRACDHVSTDGSQE